MDDSFESLSEEIFGEGNAFSATEVRKRLYGMKRMMEVEDSERLTNSNGSPVIYQKSLLEEIENRKRELLKETKRLQDQRREYNKLLASDARFEALADRLVLAAENLNIKLPLQNSTAALTATDNEAVLILADWHYGMVTQNIWQKFNIDVCINRVAQLVHVVNEKIAFHSPEKLHILILGDMAHGAIHTSARVASEELVCDQVMQVSELLAQTIVAVSKCVKETYVYYTYGNHLRTVQNKKDNIHADNMERLIPWWLNLRLKDNHNIHVVEPEHAEFALLSVCGFTICGTHGDLDKSTNAGKTLYTLFGNRFNKQIDYVVLADKHHHEEFESLGVETILVRALCGTDDYANQKRLYSEPGQTLMFFTPGYGRDATYHIRFTA